MDMRVANSRSQRGEDRQACDFVHGLMMQKLFYRWICLGMVGGVFCGCSEKVETEEKKAVVEEEVKELDSLEVIVAGKLNQIIIPRLDFEELTLEEAIDFLAIRTKELDQSEPIEMRGMGFVIRLEPNVSSPGIPELRLRNVSVAAALRYICLMTDMRCEVDDRVTLLPRDPKTPWDSFGSVLEEKGDARYIENKIRYISIPRVDFENTSIHEAIDYLRLRSLELDVTTIDSGRKGINFVLYLPKDVAPPYIDKLQRANASFEEVLKEICIKTGMRYELDQYSVILVPKDLK